MEHWIEQIDKNTAAFIEAFGGLSAEKLNWKPDADRWSIAQNIDHLIAINSSYFPLLKSLQNGTYKKPFLGKIGFMVSFFGKMILKSVQPEEKRKAKTMSIWQPTQSELSADILDQFKVNQDALKSAIVNSKDLLNKGTVISSPANRNIVYTLDKAFDIIVTHEQRHLKQAKEVYQLLRDKS